MADDRLKKKEITIRKRVECEERAYHIVNKLVDGCVDGPYLTECGKRISQDNYDDVVEERSITKLCGYPLCDQDLPNVPKKKYHISTKANKVYDISERKKFCSNQCFKASNIFKQQIPESPVWAREKEKINIAISPHKGVPGLVGDEVIGERPKNILEKELETLEELDTRFGERHKENEDWLAGKEENGVKGSDNIGSERQDPAVASKSGLTHEELSASRPEGRGESAIVLDLHINFEKLDLNKSDPSQIEPPKSSVLKPQQSSTKLEQLQILLNKRKNVLSGMVDLQETTHCKEAKEDQSQFCDFGSKSSDRKSQNIEKPTKQKAEKLVKKKEVQTTVTQSPLCFICQILKKWVSISTVDYLQFRSSKSESVDPISKKFSDLQIQVHCANLSKKLNTQENELVSFLDDDTSDIADDKEGRKEMKSIPDYKVLKDEAEQFQLKVTEFITGKNSKQNSDEKNATEDVVYIPTVDAYDQSQIRAKIVLERLDKFLPDLLIPMGLSVQDIASHIRELIYTFRLERDTIIFKPAEWTLVSLILLKMLSFKVKALQEAFERDSTIQHFSLLLKGIKHTVEDMEVFTRDILSDAAVTF